MIIWNVMHNSSCSTEVNHKVQNVDWTAIICQNFFLLIWLLIVIYLKYQTSKIYSRYVNPTTSQFDDGWMEKLLEEQMKHFMDRSRERCMLDDHNFSFFRKILFKTSLVSIWKLPKTLFFMQIHNKTENKNALWTATYMYMRIMHRDVGWWFLP